MTMFSPVISKLESGVFKLEYKEIPDFELVMNFNPLIERFKLIPPFCLVHWQAKPKNQRRWGVYDAQIDNYFSVLFNRLEFNQGKSRPLQIDESIYTTVPTAVVLFDNCRVEDRGYLKVV